MVWDCWFTCWLYKLMSLLFHLFWKLQASSPLHQGLRMLESRGKTDGLTRKQRILDLQPKLSFALQALHTGLTTVSHQAPGLKSCLSWINTLMDGWWTKKIKSRILTRYEPILVKHMWNTWHMFHVFHCFGRDVRHLWVTPFFVDNKTEDFTFRIPWSCCHWCLRIDPRVRVWTLRWSSDCSWKASRIKCWPSDVAGPGEDEQVMFRRNSWCKMRHSFMRHLQIDHGGVGGTNLPVWRNWDLVRFA